MSTIPTTPITDDAAGVSSPPSRTHEGRVIATIRYFAAARAATGVDEEQISLSAPTTISQLIDAATARHGDEFARVLGRCSFLHNTVAVHSTDGALADGDVVDVLPPFAGG